MARQKNDGRGRLGGRAKGTPNKTTGELREWIASILNNGKEKFENELGWLQAEEYVKAFTGLLNYVLPKQAPISPDETLRKEKEMMQELLLSMPEEMVDRIAKRLIELKEKEDGDKIEQH